MMAARRKPKVRRGALMAVLATLGGVAVTVVSDPHVTASLAGKLGVSAALLGAIVQALTKPAWRDDSER
jgi:drug/metabolite transporter (DMT)-like permease